MDFWHESFELKVWFYLQKNLLHEGIDKKKIHNIGFISLHGIFKYTFLLHVINNFTYWHQKKIKSSVSHKIKSLHF